MVDDVAFHRYAWVSPRLSHSRGIYSGKLVSVFALDSASWPGLLLKNIFTSTGDELA